MPRRWGAAIGGPSAAVGIGENVRPLRVTAPRRLGAAFRVDVPRWSEDKQVFFSFPAHVARSAGYESCRVMSPELFGNPAEAQKKDETAWDRANRAGFAAARLFRASGATVPLAPLSDAVVELGVPKMVPDRGLLDAGAVVVRDHARVSCTAPRARTRAARDDFYYFKRVLATAARCGSLQTFRSDTAVTDFNRDLFLAGFALSTFLAAFFPLLVRVWRRMAAPPRGESAPTGFD